MAQDKTLRQRIKDGEVLVALRGSLHTSKKELADIEGYNFNGDVFLSGYSEGGFATMSAHYNLENNIA